MYKIEENNSLGNTSASDSPNENGKREKRTRNRPSKEERFTWSILLRGLFYRFPFSFGESIDDLFP